MLTELHLFSSLLIGRGEDVFGDLSPTSKKKRDATGMPDFLATPKMNTRDR